MFSKSCEYALRATIYLAQKTETGENSGLNAIAKGIDSPIAFTSKILQELKKKELIISIKGPNGGFAVPKEKLNTKLSAIVSAIDGDKIFEGCGLGLNRCDANAPCPLHDDFMKIRAQLNEILNSNTLKSIILDTNKNLILLKR